MKTLRKWSRILHRDIGFFFIGASIVYGVSGLAINHIGDWNPKYSITIKNFNTELTFTKDNAKEQIETVLNDLSVKETYKTHYFPDKNTLKAYLTSDSKFEIDLTTGDGQIEILRKRFFISQANYLHYNPNRWWTWFSDAFAVALILFAITSLFMVRGKKGAAGRGAIYIVAGVIIPLLIFFLT